MKFTADGAGSVSVDAGDPEGPRTGAALGGSDSGVGMRPEQAPASSNPSRQVDGDAAPIRRHRAGAGDLKAAGRAAGRRDRAGQRTGARLNVWFSVTLPTHRKRETAGSASRRPPRASAARAGAPAGRGRRHQPGVATAVLMKAGYRGRRGRRTAPQAIQAIQQHDYDLRPHGRADARHGRNRGHAARPKPAAAEGRGSDGGPDGQCLCGAGRGFPGRRHERPHRQAHGESRTSPRRRAGWLHQRRGRGHRLEARGRRPLRL